jgi:cupin 2 domain-containing protein
LKTNSGNILELPALADTNMEFFELLAGKEDLKIERIISFGNITPEGFWYDQESDEWVVLILGNARLVFENEDELELVAGDYILIPAHRRHRVSYTSENPPCIWLAIHGEIC